VGIRELVWLPIWKLTVMDDKSDWSRFMVAAQEGTWYCLNEIPYSITDELETKTQWFKKDSVAHFNWGRKEYVRDINTRPTYNIFTLPPTESLATKLIWKLSLMANDMLLREVMVPREHHQLPSEAFNPDFFQGASQEDRITAAQTAAQSILNSYAKGLEGRRVDRGYVTLDNVAIEIKESRVPYTSPNDILDQIDEAINKSMGVPESALSGRAAGRSSFASEIAVGAYLIIKAEFVAERIAEKVKELAITHLTIKHPNGRFQKYFDQIEFKLQLVFFKTEIARMMAVLASLGIFTQDELRDMLSYDPLTPEQKDNVVMIGGFGGFAQSAGQVSATSQTGKEPVQAQRTAQSKAQTQRT